MNCILAFTCDSNDLTTLFRDNRQKQEYWSQQLTMVRRAHQEDINESKSFTRSLPKRATPARPADDDEEKGSDDGEEEVKDNIDSEQPLADHAPEYLAK